MKKLLIALTAVLAFGSGVADAAVPEGGYFLDKNGVPLTKEQSTPPKIKTHPTPPMSRLVYNAVKALPHSSSTIIRLTVNEDGFPVGPAVTQSAGSVILDEYAVKSVINWTFIPAKMGDKAVNSTVEVPVRRRKRSGGKKSSSFDARIRSYRIGRHDTGNARCPGK